MEYKTETELVEFKSIWKDEYLKHICSFANNRGGRLYIGISDTGDVIGLKNTRKILENIPSKIINYLGIIPRLELHKENNLQFIEITIDSNIEPISYKGKYYIRSGATTQELNGKSLQNFLLKKNNTTWDEIGIEHATLNDIDTDTVKSFIEKAILANRMTIEARNYDIQTLFENLNLFDNTGAIKRAAILAFSNKPSKFFPSLSFKIGRFVSETNIVVQDIIDDNLFTLAENIMPILESKYLKSIISYKGIQRVETLEYPRKALREAILNAIVHRDYNGTFTQMRVKNESLSIWNAGNLPEQLSIELLKQQHASIPRNRTLANLFFRAGYIEVWGRGISVIFNECRNYKIPQPIISENSGGFCIDFIKNVTKENVTKENVTKENVTKKNRQQNIINILTENPSLTIDEIAEMLNLTRRTILREIDTLKELSLITRIGGRKKGFWKIS